MAAVCHRVGKNDKKFDNKSKGDDCHHGVYDNNNNNWNETQSTDIRYWRMSKHKHKEAQIVNIVKSYQILFKKLKYQQRLGKK